MTVTLAPVNNAQTVTVAYATADGTATTANNDYAATNGTLTFDPGAATQTFTVAINGDTAIEANETVLVNLSAPANAAIGDSQGVLTISTDDVPGAPTVSIDTPAINPGGAFQVSVAGGPANRMDWVALVPAGGPDNAYVEWFYLNGQKTAPAAGVSSATVPFVAPTMLGTYNARFYTNNQLVKLATSNTLTVANGPTLSANDVTVTEGNAGTALATFTVTLAPVNASQTVTVDYATVDGTATAANSDYVPASGTLTFSPSQSTQTITVTVNGDTAIELNEFFGVNLSNAVNAIIGDSQALTFIMNDDVPAGPTVNVGVASVAPGALFTVTVTNGPANPRDWVAVVQAAAPDNAYQDWVYLNGMKSPPATGLPTASVQLRAPTVPGTYNVRFYGNNSSANKLATSGTFTVP
jgi:hypothetical protein